MTGAAFIILNLLRLGACINIGIAWSQASMSRKSQVRMNLTVITTIGVVASRPWAFFGEFCYCPRRTAIRSFGITVAMAPLSWRTGNWVADVRMLPSKPTGINPQDPYGQDDVVVNDPNMRLAVNQPVQALLRSHDVLHNYTVPQFRVKMDLVPGMVSYLWFDPTREGTYDLLCEELAG